MMMMFMTSWLLIVIPLIIMNLSTILAKKIKFNKEKMNSFECGFNLISFPRNPFSFSFFLITIIFLIFDVEIALLLPLIKTLKFSTLLNWLFTTITFLMILLLGILHEWNQKALEWH